jgi:hypothetical protein
MSYPKFGSIPRWYKTFTISEKIDGTNALISVVPVNDELFDERYDEAAPVATIGGMNVFAGSRTRWISPGKSTDNHGFAGWVRDHAEDAVALGEGFHYGEWFGSGINRGYGLEKGQKRFALFNTYRWSDPEVRPGSFDVVPILWEGSGDYLHEGIDSALWGLRDNGSQLVPGFDRPEGIVIYSHEVNKYWKKTIEHDRIPKDLIK